MTYDRTVQLILLLGSLIGELKRLADEEHITIDEYIKYNSLINSCNDLIEQLERSL